MEPIESGRPEQLSLQVPVAWFRHAKTYVHSFLLSSHGAKLSNKGDAGAPLRAFLASFDRRAEGGATAVIPFWCISTFRATPSQHAISLVPTCRSDARTRRHVDRDRQSHSAYRGPR